MAEGGSRCVFLGCKSGAAEPSVFVWTLVTTSQLLFRISAFSRLTDMCRHHHVHTRSAKQCSRKDHFVTYFLRWCKYVFNLCYFLLAKHQQVSSVRIQSKLKHDIILSLKKDYFCGSTAS